MLNISGNGNEWLILVTGTPSTSYVNDYGMGVLNVGADYVQVGDAETQADLYNSGMVSQEV